MTPAALTLAVDDQGLPFRQTLKPADPQPDAEGSSPQACLRDRGLSLAHKDIILISAWETCYRKKSGAWAWLAGAAVVGLDLPLAQGGTPYLCDAAEADGFFFSGVRPYFAPDGDFLRLQYLNAELDLERLHLYSPFARELLAYILQEKARVGQKS